MRRALNRLLSGRLGLWVLLLGGLTACSSGGDDPDTGSATVNWEHTTMTSEAGVARLRIADDAAPGLRYTAEITSGDWASFGYWSRYELTKSGEVGTSLGARLIDIYYLDNTETTERTLTVRFTFEGREPVVLSLKQPALGNVTPTPSETTWSWPELPAKVENANWSYVTHFCPVYDQTLGKEVTKRNFSLCFDKTKRASWWVAYPMHSVYLGSLSRPNPDPWAFDPEIESSWQANLAMKKYPLSEIKLPWRRLTKKQWTILPRARRSEPSQTYRKVWFPKATPQIWQFSPSTPRSTQRDALPLRLCPSVLRCSPATPLTAVTSLRCTIPDPKSRLMRKR